MDALARSWKLLLAVAVIIGAFGFFKPYYMFPKLELGLSGWRMLVGFEHLADIHADTGIPPEAADTDSGRARLAEINASIKSDFVTEIASTGTVTKDANPPRNRIPLSFGAVALLLCVAFYALVEGRLGTGAAWLVVIFALGVLWGFVRSWWRIGDNPTVELASGAYLLALSGALALIAGVGALIRDDPGGIFRNAPVVEGHEPEDDDSASASSMNRL